MELSVSLEINAPRVMFGKEADTVAWITDAKLVWCFMGPC